MPLFGGGGGGSSSASPDTGISGFTQSHVPFGGSDGGFDTDASFTYTDASNLLTLVQAGIATTSTPSIALSNTTAATVGATRQFSPAITFTSSAWDTDGATASEQTWRIDSQPINGNLPDGDLVFSSKYGSDAYETLFHINNRYGLWLDSNAFINGSGLNLGDGTVAQFGFTPDQGGAFEVAVTIPLAADTVAGSSSLTRGVVLQARQNSDTSNSEFVGTTVNSKLDNSITTTTFRAFDIRARVYAGSTATTTNLANIRNPESGGTYTTLNGLNIESLTRGSTNNAIKTGTGNVDFGGRYFGPLGAFANQDATPSVATGNVFKTANGSATTITMFDDGVAGQEITVIIGDANTTIDFSGTNLEGNGGSDWSPTTNDHMTCVFDGTNWFCNISDNTA